MVLVWRMVFSSLLGSRNGNKKDVVSTENFEGDHISTVLLTPCKHDRAKIVILHQLGHCPTLPP